MKKSHVFIIVIIAASIGIIISTAGDASSYVTFDKAKAMAENGDNNKIHVVGELKKDAQGNIVGLYPGANKLSFSFIMVDEQGMDQEVYYNEPMPADFTRSEKVVVVGGYEQEVFIADKILMKCPSKYEETSVEATM